MVELDNKQKTDNELRQEFLEEQREKMNQFVQDMTQQNNRNMGDEYFSVVEKANGPEIAIKGAFDPFHLPDGWQYEPAYLLDSDYPKEGFCRMMNGKWEFMPIENIEDKSIVREYKDIIDVRSALLAANPQIDTDQIQADPNTGAILLVGILNENIQMPQGLKNENGMISDMNDYNKTFEINEVSPLDYHNYVNSGRATTRMKDQAYHKEALDQETENVENVNLAISPEMLDFVEMKQVYNNAARNKKNTLMSNKESDGSYQVMSNREVKGAKDQAQYHLAEIWVRAYNLASGRDNGELVAFDDGMTAICEKGLKICKQMSGRNLYEMAEAMFNEFGLENSGVVKTILYFASQKEISSMLNIQTQGMTPEGAITKYEQEKADYLEDEAEELVRLFKPNNNSNQ